jgi:AmiR/NasT family two-component response regulator
MAKSLPMQATSELPAQRFLRSAELCRARDLKRLSILGELVRVLSALIHALQKERGSSSIFLGSRGAQFSGRVAERVADSEACERALREQMDHVDEKLDQFSGGAHFYGRVALAFSALECLPEARGRIATLAMTPIDAVKSFTDVIAALLAVGFEAADAAADPATSRALVAMVSFAQGKEYAGQERAIAGAALSRGGFDAPERARLEKLQVAQERAFEIFGKFADPKPIVAYRELAQHPDMTELTRLRSLAWQSGRGADAAGAQDWYEITTRRIDRMRAIEETLAAELGVLCASKLREAEQASGTAAAGDQALKTGTPVAMLVAAMDPNSNHSGIEGGVSLYAADGDMPQPMRSILDVVGAQSRRIEDMNSQLESAQSALAERKVIERAKGLLMRSRRLSEKDAYALLRQTAMNQNKRIADIAAALVSMADLLPP